MGGGPGQIIYGPVVSTHTKGRRRGLCSAQPRVFLSLGPLEVDFPLQRAERKGDEGERGWRRVKGRARGKGDAWEVCERKESSISFQNQIAVREESIASSVPLWLKGKLSLLTLDNLS